MTKRQFFNIVLLSLLSFLFESSSIYGLTCKVKPNHIGISFFYNGTNMHISGHSEQIGDIAVVISDKPETLVLRRKEKVKGLFWMNVGEISFNPVPITFMVFSSRPIGEILKKDQIVKYGIGYHSLFQKVKIDPDPGKDKIKWIKEFIHFKENLRLYCERFNSIKIKKGPSSQDFFLSFHWPYQAPPGIYNVSVYLIKDKKVSDQCFKTIKIEKVGLLNTISNLAFNQPAIYGIIAIIIAVVAGIGVGLIFGGGKGGH